MSTETKSVLRESNLKITLVIWMGALTPLVSLDV